MCVLFFLLWLHSADDVIVSLQFFFFCLPLISSLSKCTIFFHSHRIYTIEKLEYFENVSCHQNLPFQANNFWNFFVFNGFHVTLKALENHRYTIPFSHVIPPNLFLLTLSQWKMSKTYYWPMNFHYNIYNSCKAIYKRRMANARNI